ncbi:MAG: hypothetical protein ABIQ74_05130 [Chitinophagales bacterium]
MKTKIFLLFIISIVAFQISMADNNVPGILNTNCEATCSWSSCCSADCAAPNSALCGCYFGIATCKCGTIITSCGLTKTPTQLGEVNNFKNNTLGSFNTTTANAVKADLTTYNTNVSSRLFTDASLNTWMTTFKTHMNSLTNSEKTAVNNYAIAHGMSDRLILS